MSPPPASPPPPTAPPSGNPASTVPRSLVPPRLPSARVSAGLAAVMLALGVGIGAAIGPAPSPTLAGQPAPSLLRSLAGLVSAGRAGAAPAAPSTSTAGAPPTSAAAPVDASAGAGTAASAGLGNGGAGGRGAGNGTQPVNPGAPSGSGKPPAIDNGASGKLAPEGHDLERAPPVTSIWLITLDGGTFGQALSQPGAAPYITELVKAGTLLSGWSGLAGEAFASEAGLLAGAPPQNLDSIVQPPCPEGAAGASCAPETAGAMTAADAFVKATVPAIIASAAYRAHGLIVITFATVADATAAGLPAGASTATLGSEPAAGVLLISPFARAGARPHTRYDPAAPTLSLSGLLR